MLQDESMLRQVKSSTFSLTIVRHPAGPVAQKHEKMLSDTKDYFNAKVIVQYNDIYKDVALKMAAAKEAEGEHPTAMAILTEAQMYDIKIINLNHQRWLSQMTRAVEQGHTVLIENVSEKRPTLDPILSRAITKKGRSMRIRIADEEKDYDPKFKLYLQTMLSHVD